MSGALHGYGGIARKELLHLLRDPASVVIALLIPAIQLTLIGFAIDFDVRHIRTVVVDMDRSRESRSYLESLRNTQYLNIEAYAETPGEAMHQMRRGRARVAIIIPPDFARRARPGDAPVVRVLIDGSDSQVAIRARTAFAGSAASPALDSSHPEARISLLYNPEMRTQVFLIPGLIGVVLQLVTVSLTAFSLVREKEQGTLEQLMVSPVGRLGLMLGKLTPYAGLAMLEMASVLILGRVVFNVHVAGSLILLLLLTVPFVAAALSMGLLISTVAQNQAQALQFTLVLLLPSVLLSGFIFPRETMPGPIYLLTFAFPVTFFLEILRGIIVRGAVWTDLVPQTLALLAQTSALIGLATARFRKTIS